MRQNSTNMRTPALVLTMNVSWAIWSYKKFTHTWSFKNNYKNEMCFSCLESFERSFYIFFCLTRKYLVLSETSYSNVILLLFWTYFLLIIFETVTARMFVCYLLLLLHNKTLNLKYSYLSFNFLRKLISQWNAYREQIFVEHRTHFSKEQKSCFI